MTDAMTNSNQQPANDSIIFLYGPSGSGKSAAGRRLAAGLNRTFIDLDEQIEIAAGRTIPEIFAEETEAGFRARERAALQAAVADAPGVISLGGGALLDPENQGLAERSGQVVCLTAPLGTLVARLSADETNARPLLDGGLQERLEALLAKRAGHYAAFPVRLETGALTLDQVVFELQVLTGQFHIRGMGPGYDVRIRPGLLDQAPGVIRGLSLSGPFAVVTDSNVGRFYGPGLLVGLGKAGEAADLVKFSAGEAHKTLATTEAVWDAFLEKGLERRSTVLALGGGVVGDLAGFAASAYLRGVSWVNIPTSLLAMVDASIGGKTGVDLPQGKNLIGAFHPPRLVLVDPETLATLPRPELRSGMAEVVKHGVIGDPDLFALCEAGWEALEMDWTAVVRRAMALKIRVIQEDPFEGGLREVLNLGHTVGHAVELVSEFRLRHGEAVAIGMVAEARLAEKIGLAEQGLSARIAQTLRGLDLPTEIPSDLDPALIVRAMRVDKKKARGTVRFALPEGIGSVKPGVTVEDLNEVF